MHPALRLRISAGGLSSLAGLLIAAIVALPAQQSAPDMGKIHGSVINPAGIPQRDGTVSLSVDGGVTLSYSFPVSSSGDYSGEAPPGEYTVVYRAPDTPEGKIVDYISGVQVVAGQDTAQDVDMTRQEFVARLSPEQQTQLQELREANAASATDARRDAASINADLQIVNLDFQATENARVTAAQDLSATPADADVDEMTAEIESAKLSEIETLMTKDTSADPTEPVLWIDLARAQTGLENYLDAETNFKKALGLAQKAVPPRPEVVGAAEAGLGEVYARTLMVDEANAAFDAAAKADPPSAARYLRNQAVIFYEARNFPAQIDAADKAIQADPNQAILYYIKAAGLAEDARVDPESNKIVLPPGCADAFRKYLQLAPTGLHAIEVATILEKAGEATSASDPAAAGPAPGATPANPAP
jgi:tetratricopeptide (TPR) repeat protein